MSRQGSWERKGYELSEGRLVQAEREIKANFSDKASIEKKAKSIVKFGKSASLTIGALETVWTVGGNEVYLTDNLITHVSSSNVGDTGLIEIEGHTIAGSDVNEQFTFVTQPVVLNGQNKVALQTPVARVSRAYNNNGVNLLGRISVYEDTAITGGVPNDSTKIHIDIPLGFQSTFKAATTVSNTDYLIITGGFGSVSLKQAAAVDFYLEVKGPGKVFRQVAALSASSSSGPWSVDLNPAVIIPKNHDVRVRAEAGTNGAVVFTNFKGYFAKVIS